MSKYLKFVKVNSPNDMLWFWRGKYVTVSIYYDVVNKKTNELVGVCYKPPYSKRYWFDGCEDIVLDSVCMRDIANYCDFLLEVER